MARRLREAQSRDGRVTFSVYSSRPPARRAVNTGYDGKRALTNYR